MLERFAHEALVTGDVPDALAAQEQALTTWRSLGDRVREGRCLVDLAGLLWFAGRGDLALATARAAAEQLAVAAPDSAELARALSVLAQRLAVAGADDQSAEEVASRALELAERLGAEPIAVHALTTIGIARIFEGDDRGWALLEQAAARARSADLPEETLRALINLVEAALDLRRYDLAEDYLAQADAYLEAHDLGLYDDILRSRIAALELEAGRWDRALADAEALLARRSTANPVRVRALTVRGLIHLRRGMVGGWTDLDAALVLDAGEIQELLPLRAARAEAAWLGDDLARGQEEATLGIGVGDRLLSPWWWSELAFWAWRCGASGPSPHPDERPYWLHAEGRPSEAAAMWASLGAPYREASALADTGREPALRRALETFNALGARVMARRTTIALQALGATRIARGPSATTRTNAALLTARQRDVLECLGEGLPNAAIARRLVISPKTVDHHVSAILRKLDVHDRDAAVAAARRLGLPVAGSRDGEAGSAT